MDKKKTQTSRAFRLIIIDNLDTVFENSFCGYSTVLTDLMMIVTNIVLCYEIYRKRRISAH